MSLYETEVNFDEIAPHVQTILEPTLHLKGLTFEIDVSPETPCIRGDSRRVTQIIIALVETAEKFTPASPRAWRPTGHDGAQAIACQVPMLASTR